MTEQTTSTPPPPTTPTSREESAQGARLERLRRGADVVTAVLVVGALFVPLVVSVVFGESATSTHENRALAERPRVPRDLDELALFPKRFSTYYKDHFGGRDQLIRWNNLGRLRYLGTSALSKVIPGKEGWLFYGNDEVVRSFCAIKPLRRDELEHWKIILEDRRTWLAERGARYLYVIAPNKHSVYPEFVPDSVNRVRQDSALDQIAAFLDSSTVEFVDVRDALRAAKSVRRVYERTGTHWNQFGAHIGYREGMRILEGWFPQLETPPLENFEVVAVDGVGADLAGMLSLQDVLREEVIELRPRTPRRHRVVESTEEAIVTEVDDPRLPRAVIFRDSFTDALLPFLSEHFHRAVYVSEKTFEPGIVEREKPDVVITEMVERSISGSRL